MNKYLTIKQACAALQVCRNTLLAMIQDGRVEAVDIRRPGGKNAVWRVDSSVLGSVPDEEIARKIKLLEIAKRIGL